MVESKRLRHRHAATLKAYLGKSDHSPPGTRHSDSKSSASGPKPPTRQGPLVWSSVLNRDSFCGEDPLLSLSRLRGTTRPCDDDGERGQLLVKKMIRRARQVSLRIQKSMGRVMVEPVELQEVAIVSDRQLRTSGESSWAQPGDAADYTHPYRQSHGNFFLRLINSPIRIRIAHHLFDHQPI